MINNSPSSIEVASGLTAKGVQTKPVDNPDKKIEVVSATEESTSVENKEVLSNAPVSMQDEEKALQQAIKASVAEVIPKVRELMQKNQRSLDFKVAEQENRVIITVIDKETDEVIRQIPPEDVIQIAKSMGQGIDDALLGILVDSYA
ncbi:flagellar protein FlaG [Ketobacter sp. MCCC 1A13808]|uniref:flagellar protein FlaG n=1 Tax=Ketobacter sp. MCCC 1A13808 TaxID=2602738 RepID=UPI0012EB2E36|nr:flagellar protein FlaG [Ketobacter sp. MCCC 1A13808]MVF12832.1 flagellar protein FlaG [Ketobacter sp. MCCC 1A13808]